MIMKPSRNRPTAALLGLALATLGTAVFGSAAAPGQGPAARVIGIRWDRAQGRATVTNGRLELVVETKSGFNARSLRDARSGWVLADRDYSWPGGRFPELRGEPVISRLSGGGQSIAFKGKLDAIEVEQTFSVPLSEPGVVIERITIRNPGREPVSTADFKCGFAKHIGGKGNWNSDAARTICPLPYRRETNGKMQEFPLREVAERGMSYEGWFEEPLVTSVWGADGWVWTGPKAAFLLAKYNPLGMEWALMEPETRGGEVVIRFGGAGLWKHGHPEAAASLAPGADYAFGETRLQVVDGDWKQAFYAYRGDGERKGLRAPADYDPPVHWNELYDNEYYFKCVKECEKWITTDKLALEPGFFPINRELLKRYYTLDLMLVEAAKARDLGCQALYLDPGWDTGPNQQVWDAERLGPMDGFVKRMGEEFGLKVSLWSALGCMPPSYGDPAVGPPESRVVDEDGKLAAIPCFASPAFLDLKEKRLLDLCRAGAAFLMFDSDQFSGPCYAKSHGHKIPSTREEHANALLELIRRVKKQYPRVLIELHDPISGPSGIHYTPTYFGFGRPNSFDCLWGHEFMWDPLDDILSLRATSLYYFNLAYDIPLYLHVNLKKDNESSLIFWWFASLCRHLGVGGKPGPAVWEAEKRAMQTYKPLKEFYSRGVFYGIEETVHAHVLPERRAAVINAFNLGDKPERKTIRFRPEDIGLAPGPVEIEGVPAIDEAGTTVLTIDLPPRGHRLLKVNRPSPDADREGTGRGFDPAAVDPGDWVGRYLLDPASQRPPFGFDYGGRPSGEWLKTCSRHSETTVIEGLGKRHTLTWSDPKTGLKVGCVAVEYADFPTVEWTLHFKNEGPVDTPILSGIQALDVELRRGPFGEFVLHRTVGDGGEDIYKPEALTLGPGLEKRVAPEGGRPSSGEFPYFNIEGSGGGMIVAIGWPGQWAAGFARDRAVGLRVTAGQELTRFKLHPGEELRSPLIVVQFWKGDAGRAQNVWRKWMMAHNLPRPGGKAMPPQLNVCNGNQFGYFGITEDNQRAWIRRYRQEGIAFDYWWCDLSWFALDEKSLVFNARYDPDPVRFPRGLKPLSDDLHRDGAKLIAWFEPEHYYPGPGNWLSENHPEWLLKSPPGHEKEINQGMPLKNRVVLDLGNPEALKWLTDNIGRVIREQGIDYYRHDFNVEPLIFWRANDAPDRQGVTEIKYVTGFLDYYDQLLGRHPGLLIDNCASGGRRNDVETLRRSVPLLRSDTWGEPVGQQCQTYGLSNWIPFWGTGITYSDPRDLAYIFRSQMGPSFSAGWDLTPKADYSLHRKLLAQWQAVRDDILNGDYYPLTPYSPAADAWMAWQFDRPETRSGVVQTFRRTKSAEVARNLRLRGLDPGSAYSVKDLDTGVSRRVSGLELMEKGLTVEIKEAPGSAVIVYQRTV